VAAWMVVMKVLLGVELMAVWKDGIKWVEQKVFLLEIWLVALRD